MARRQILLSGLGDKDNKQIINIYHKFYKRNGSFVEWEGSDSDSPCNGKIMIAWGTGNPKPYMTWSSRITYIDN